VLFPTITFAIFFLVVYAVNWVLMPRLRLWKWMILGVSYVFYGSWDWRMLVLLAAATVANQAFAVQIWRARQGGRAAAGSSPATRSVRPPAAARLWLGLAVVADLALLGCFKYAGFFAENLNELLRVFHLGAPLPLLRLALPVGISFLVFRLLTYVIDVYRGELRPAPSLDFGVYVAFFPYLLAGPIARARDFLPQLTSPRNPYTVDAGRAFFLILAGLFKKVVIADFLATHLVNGLFASPQQYSAWEALVGIVAFSVQIYCDFSGYSDIAIGIALLLGFELPENFNAPYTATSVRDFWRRWHMTLSSWLRDYLYIPLGGNRKGRRRTAINILVTMLLAGLWHGAAWTFVLWGGLHGAAQVWEHGREGRRARGRDGEGRRARGRAEPGSTAGARALQRLAVFAFVTFAWVFFRAESMAAAFAVLWRLVAGLGSIGSAVTPAVLGLTALGIAAQYVPRGALLRLQAGLGRIGWAGQAATLAVCLFLIDTLGPTGVAEFLYFRF
jgi:alginate O-acetyltransferase complex protein AlgI